MSTIKYSSQIIGKEDFLLKTSLNNTYQSPELVKISLNLGILDVVKEKKKILLSLISLEVITGQKAITTRSKKINPSLKIRRGMILGSKITLRKNSSFSFLDKLCLLILPQIRNLKIFHVASNSHLSFRVENPLVFLELENKFMFFTNLPFLDITLVSNSSNKLENTLFFSQFFLPFYSKKS